MPTFTEVAAARRQEWRLLAAPSVVNASIVVEGGPTTLAKAHRLSPTRETTTSGFQESTGDVSRDTWRVWGLDATPVIVPERTSVTMGQRRYRVASSSERWIDGALISHDLALVSYLD
jgi:hypothetical protein